MNARIIIAALLLAGCTTGDGNYFNEPDAGTADRPDFAARPAIFDVRVEPSTIDVGYDETFVIEPLAYDRNGNIVEDVEFTLEYDGSVIDPQIDNRYRAVDVGETEFRATVDGIDGFAQITVGAQRVGSFDIQIGDPSLGIGESTAVQVEPLSVLGGTYQTPDLLDIEVLSSNPEFADFDDSGRLVAVAPGTTEIIARGQGVQSSREVAVFEYELDSITLDVPRRLVIAGHSGPFNWRANWNTEEPGQYFVSFSSSNPDVVRIQAGQYVAVAAGTATITARVDGYDVEGTTEMEVVDTYDSFAMLGTSRVLALVRGALVGEQLDGFRFINQLPDSYAAIGAGIAHACMLRTDGLVACWGASNFGQNGRTRDTQTPNIVALGETATDIRIAGNRSCALIGTGWICWGDFGGTAQPGPTAVTFSEFGMSLGHVCELEQGTITCSGNNTAGQLGLGTTSPTDSGTVASAETFVDVIAGPDFSCARTATDTYCWGNGDDGQLGSLPFDDSATPRRVDTSRVFTAIAAGTAHVCGLTVAGEIYCWGQNDSGQVGDASFQTRPTPVKVESPLEFVEVAAADDRSCGLTDTGALLCWGANPGANSPFPVRVPLRLSQLF